MLKVMVVVLLLAVAAVFAGTAAASPGTAGSVDGHTRAFVKQLEGCETITGLAIKIIQKNPNDVLGASSAVNTAKSTCQAIRDRMVGMDTSHFSDQALNGEIAVDYWTRGLGRFSNYIDDGRPSDVTKAAEYFGDARATKNLCLRGINQRRAVYGLPGIQ